MAKTVIRPLRANDYEVKTSTGFALRPLNADSLLLESFVDLPPLAPVTDPKTNEEIFVVERRHNFGLVMSREEARRFAERLNELLDKADELDKPAAQQ